MCLKSKVHIQNLGFWFKGPLSLLLLFCKKHLWVLFFPLTFWLLTRIDYPSESINWIFPLLPLPPIPCWQMKRKEKQKGGTKYLMVKSDSPEAEVEERNLIVPLLAHVFSIDYWFSSVFIITISGNILPLQDGYPIWGLPISCAFPSSGPPLGHINITACQKWYHRWPEQVWGKKEEIETC